jgi:hypothetical protein
LTRSIKLLIRSNGANSRIGVSPIGIDFGKEVFHVVGLGMDVKIAFRRKIKRLAPSESFRQYLESTA